MRRDPPKPSLAGRDVRADPSDWVFLGDGSYPRTHTGKRYVFYRLSFRNPCSRVAQPLLKGGHKKAQVEGCSQ